MCLSAVTMSTARDKCHLVVASLQHQKTVNCHSKSKHRSGSVWFVCDLFLGQVCVSASSCSIYFPVSLIYIFPVSLICIFPVSLLYLSCIPLPLSASLSFLPHCPSSPLSLHPSFHITFFLHLPISLFLLQHFLLFHCLPPTFAPSFSPFSHPPFSLCHTPYLYHIFLLLFSLSPYIHPSPSIFLPVPPHPNPYPSPFIPPRW